MIISVNFLGVQTGDCSGDVLCYRAHQHKERRYWKLDSSPVTSNKDDTINFSCIVTKNHWKIHESVFIFCMSFKKLTPQDFSSSQSHLSIKNLIIIQLYPFSSDTTKLV